MSIAVKANPMLWEKVKREVLRSPKGGPIGKWSARKAQLSVHLYKSRGGTYKGRKTSANSLTKWTNEKWGYINETEKIKKSRRLPRKKSRSPRKYGRYLPLEVRKRLTPYEKRLENRKKGTKYGKRVPYSKSVAKKVRNVIYK